MITFGWNDKEVYLNPVALYDVKATIIDKDDNKHNFVVKGKYHQSFADSDRVFAISTESLADSILERQEYLRTIAGLKIPRCNIKHVTYERFNHREETPSYTNLGIKNWRSFEWFVVLFVGGLATAFLGMMALMIYCKATGLK